MIPALPAAIHVPDLRLSDRDRVIAARVAARFVAGITLGIGALALFGAAIAKSEAAGVVVPVAWSAALLFAAVARLWRGQRSRVEVGARTLSWAVLFGSIGLIGPLTLHWLGLAIGIGLYAGNSDFSEWVMASAIVVGHTHLVFAAMLACRGWRGTGPHAGIIWLAATGVTLLDCVPFGFYGLIPAAYVAITGAIVLVATLPLRRACAREHDSCCNVTR